MKIASWNCRGIGNMSVRKHVKLLLNMTKADVLYLLELRTNKIGAMVGMVNNLGFSKHFLVETNGFAGGLLLLWKHGQMNIDIIGQSSQAIHASVKDGLTECLITFAYVRPNVLAKTRFWEDCKAFNSSTQSHWVLLGDLNDIASAEEQWGSEAVSQNALQRFCDAYNSCGLFDMGASGSRFTWCRQAGNRVV
ncbi:PREDICTED: uncharacterized protein LOC109147437 [Ipomoea nil]|uniref:uncharacterized protein LOC109147437 n=1 Tax=Ipomoea nil TaxID=35883 RepID=UPI000901CBF5|nr:PREDICTED: uncharacterized protein LOC109147437 [Ipomoea nil]